MQLYFNKIILFLPLLFFAPLIAFSQEIPEEFYLDFLLYDNNASNTEISLSVDKFTYAPGDNAKLFGFVHNVISDDKVIIQILDSLGNIRNEILVTITNEGIFEVQNKIPEDAKSGEYQVLAKFGSNGVPILLGIKVQNITIETFVEIPKNSNFQSSDLTFNPQQITVESGFPIIWKNNDDTIHTVVSGKKGLNNKMFSTGVFDSGTFGPGSTNELILDKVGDYDYFCRLHPWLIGSITVIPATTPLPESSDEISDDEKYFDIFQISDAENILDWKSEECLDCTTKINLSSDKKEGKSSLEWTLQANQNAIGGRADLSIETKPLDLTDYDFLTLWIKTKGNLEFNSQIVVEDSLKNYRVLDNFNSYTHINWTKVEIPLSEFILEKEDFDSSKVTEFIIRSPVASKMQSKQMSVLLDDIHLWSLINNEVKKTNVEEPLTITTNKQIFSFFESVEIFGEVLNRESNLPVTLRIFNPENSLISINQIVPTSDNSYWFRLPLIGNQFLKSGDYKITSQYGVLEFRTELDFSIKKPTVVEKYKGFEIFDLGQLKIAITSESGELDLKTIEAKKIMPIHEINFNGDFRDSITGIKNQNFTGDVKYKNSNFGKSINFDGKTNHMLLESSLESLHPITISAWAKPSNGESYHPIITKFKDKNNRFELALNKENFAFVVGNGTKWNMLLSPQVEIGKWYHIAGVFNGTVSKMYVDGVIVDEKPFLGSEITNNALINIGKRTNVDFFYFDGDLDEIKIFDKALTLSQMDQLFKNNDVIELSSSFSINENNDELIFDSTIQEIKKMIDEKSIKKFHPIALETPEIIQEFLAKSISIDNENTKSKLTSYQTLQTVPDKFAEIVLGIEGQSVTTVAFQDRLGREESNNNANIFLQISHTNKMVNSIRGVELGGDNVTVVTDEGKKITLPKSEEIKIPNGKSKVSKKISERLHSDYAIIETPKVIEQFLNNNIELRNESTNQTINHYVMVQTVSDLFAEKELGLEGQFVSTLAFQDRYGMEESNNNLNVFLQISHMDKKINSLRGIQLGGDDIQVIINNVNQGLITKTIEIN